jgi:regulator of RNase E activity RraA
MKQPLTLQRECAIIEELKNYDTPTITNVVATYPGKSTCLSLFHPWETNWYTNQELKAMYPELGRTCGYAVTCVYGVPDPNFKSLGVGDVLRAIDKSPKPVVLLIKQDYPEELKKKNGLCGGNMATAFKSAGVVAIISDGPSRDIDEVRSLGIQYMLTGVSPGHGAMGVKAVGTTVHLCGMDVHPGEIVHMDLNGAVKFPREYLEEVLGYCKILSENEDKKMKMLASTSDIDLLTKYMQGVYD